MVRESSKMTLRLSCGSAKPHNKEMLRHNNPGIMCDQGQGVEQDDALSVQAPYFRGIKRKRKPLGWRTMAPCVTSPHPETDLPEAKKLRLCLLSKSGLRY